MGIQVKAQMVFWTCVQTASNDNHKQTKRLDKTSVGSKADTLQVFVVKSAISSAHDVASELSCNIGRNDAGGRAPHSKQGKELLRSSRRGVL